MVFFSSALPRPPSAAEPLTPPFLCGPSEPTGGGRAASTPSGLRPFSLLRAVRWPGPGPGRRLHRRPEPLGVIELTRPVALVPSSPSLLGPALEASAGRWSGSPLPSRAGRFRAAIQPGGDLGVVTWAGSRDPGRGARGRWSATPSDPRQPWSRSLYVPGHGHLVTVTTLVTVTWSRSLYVPVRRVVCEQCGGTVPAACPPRARPP